jgi:hypothetical protein
MAGQLQRRAWLIETHPEEINAALRGFLAGTTSAMKPAA